MFHNARITLTFWYLLIIMCISVAFSMVIFRMLSFELDRVERAQKIRSERFIPDRIRIVAESENDIPQFIQLDPEIIKEAKNRILITLAFINLGILGASTVLGYILAGKTLYPIKQMVDEQNQFITDASHELRTPITSLKASIEVGLRDKNLTEKDAKDILTSNLEDVNNLQVLSDGLIKLSQYQKKDTVYSIVSTPLSEIIEKAIKKTQHQATYKHIDIIHAIPSFSLEGDAGALIELFTIFLDNAIKYSPKKSMVHITAEKKDGTGTITITDQGMGIDKKDIPHVFDRFYRGDTSRTKTHVSGYGLGLSIAKQIVDRHHGSITVKSEKKKGTTFIVSLPMKHTVKVM